ncbi:MAG: hypothetical protein VYB39_00440 [Pseudomonadota bacterium]|nr:hypothetical protein [Pseudomonadota bacterium]
MRRSTLLWTVLGISVAIGLFVVKHAVQDLEDRLHALNIEIISDRDAAQVLQAEWSFLNEPARLEALSREHLGLVTISASQTITLPELIQLIAAKKENARIATTTASSKPPTVENKVVNPDWLERTLITLNKDQ